MSEPENFLSRWARLKRQRAADAADGAATPEGAPAETEAKEPRADTQPTEDATAPAAEPAFDIAKLPPIESITATTDIRAFLAPGVPPDLMRAALRRAWVADPTIRDFVGIAENQWDFNDPNAIPGFGSLGPLDDVRRLVAQVIGNPPAAPEHAGTEKPSALAGPGGESIAAEARESVATEGHLLRSENAQHPGIAPGESDGDQSAATQQSGAREPSPAPADAPPRRQHGGALPR